MRDGQLHRLIRVPPPEARIRGAELLRDYRTQFDFLPSGTWLAGRRIQGKSVGLFGVHLAPTSAPAQREAAAQLYLQSLGELLPPPPWTIWTVRDREQNLLAVAPGWWHLDTPLLLETALAPDVVDPRSQATLRLALISQRLDFYALDPQRPWPSSDAPALAFALARPGGLDFRALRATGFELLALPDVGG
ncbi:hypothetical protein HNQ09_000145 [Deinococcus budaensis]|uniref:Uncharacterized protein n=1 Tax=Deinococcus budaensis TaxID=1665626 RepID=A0A7W8LNH4_9DEIO|nr:hypothetical protein [Deinococcus budaensis]